MSGGAVVGATVTVTDVGRGIPRNVTTDNAGAYSAPDLTAGTYTVHTVYTGFKAFDRQDIQLGVGADLHVDVTLQTGEQSQTITVTGEVPDITTTNAQLSATIEGNVLSDLPIAGHNYVQLLALLPSFQLRQGSATGPTQYSNGLRAEFNVYVLDGVADQMTYYATIPINAGYSAGGPEQAVLLPTDAIQEFNVVENSKAEYGWRPGAQINVAIKSGTNALHGTAFASGRSTSLTDKNAFATFTPPVSFEDFDATVGGPIKKDKLFYLMGYEGQRSSVGNPRIIKVPTLTAGVPGGAANDIPDAIVAAGAKANPVMIAMAGCTISAAPPVTLAQVSCKSPLQGGQGLFSNTGTGTAATTFAEDYPSFGKTDNGVGKLDYHLNDHNNMAVEFFDGDGFAVAPLGVSQPYWSTPFEVHTRVVRAWWTWVPNSAWVNDARFGWDNIQISNSGNYDCPTSPGTYLGIADNQWLPGANAPNYKALYNFVGGGAPSCAFPTVTITGFSSTGQTNVLGGATTSIDTSGIERWLDTVSWTHGNHITKFGGEFNLDHGTIDLNADRNKGTLNFSNLTTFMEGVVSTYSLQVGTVPRQFTFHAAGGFIQDDWRIFPRLTLNLGLRYENTATIHEVNNLLGNVALGTPTGIIQQGQGGPLYTLDPWAFAPRFGLAWDVTGKGTTVMRTSFNILYQNPTIAAFIVPGMNTVPTGLNLVNGATTLNEGGNMTLAYLQTQTPPAGANTIQAGVPFFGPNLNLTGQCSNTAPCTIGGVVNHLQMPEVLDWNVGVEHAITNSLTLDAEYVGTHGQHLFDIADINQPTPGAKGSAAENLRRPLYSTNGTTANGLYPWLGQINVLGAIPNRSNYNALQVIAKQRNSHGLTFIATYTYSHALDSQSSDLGPVRPQNALNPAAEYGNTSFDLRHRVTMGITYIIPGKTGYAQMLQGWQVSTTTSVFSGRPFGLIDPAAGGDDISGTGEGADRWNLVGTPGDFNTKFGTTQGIPCYANLATASAAWQGCISSTSPAGQAAWSRCLSAAGTEPSGPMVVTGNLQIPTNMLNNLGCYALGNSVIIPPGQGVFGSMSRFELYSVGTWEWDASIIKNIKIKERISAQFRADIYNVTNSTFFAAPSANPSTPSSFGAATSTPDSTSPFVGTGGPRKIQLGLKILF